MKRVLLTLLLTACTNAGDDPPPAPAEPTPTPAPAAPSPAPAPAPVTAIPAPPTPSPPTPPPPASPRPRPDAKALEEDARRYVELLTAEGSGEGGGMMRKTAPGGDLNQQLQKVEDGGKQIGVGGRGADPRVGTGTGPRVDGPGGPASPPPPMPRVAVTFQVKIDPYEATQPVSTKIRSVYLAGLRRCTQKSYATGELSGRTEVILTFIISESGRTTGPSAKGASDSVRSCITSMARNWIFPPYKDEDGERTDVDAYVKLTFIPGE